MAKKIPAVDARCPMCKRTVEFVWLAWVTQELQELTDDEFVQPVLSRLTAGDVHDSGDIGLRERIVCPNPTCTFDEPATRENLLRLRPENQEPRVWAPGKEPKT